ncbi:MAG: hypothetical protein A2Y77_01825 [Planctomycetes bacterium RBG_13_62_9]|nr:MAG: hypothetical protein A2Y77_01825 [Planctomycetes bacterium RBG_13_62_9]
MKSENADRGIEIGRAYDHTARLVLVAFLLTFICARTIVFLIMSRTIPDLYAYVKGAHIHHLNYGIFLLAGVGAYLLFGHPTARGRGVVAILYGIGMGLTFDEFGMWVHLGGSYWQRASWDAVTVVGGFFALIAFAPSLKRFRPRHWITGALLICLVSLFLFLLHMSFSYAGRTLGSEIHRIESTAPH